MFGAAMFALPANAALVISGNATSNVSCASNVCTATAANAVLNFSDLQSMLASGNVKVVADATASNITISHALTWPGSSTLTLDAYHSVTVNRPTSVTGSGGLTIMTNDGGTGGVFSFGANGYVTFWNLSDALTINGAAYTLVNNIATLANDIAAAPSGSYALAASYDAAAHGKYVATPVPTALTGTFEGLGNAIRTLTIQDAADAYVGLLASIGASGAVHNLRIINANVFGSYNNGGAGTFDVGALVGLNQGAISGVSVTGVVKCYKGQYIGGMAGHSVWEERSAILLRSAKVRGENMDDMIGGLVGSKYDGTITHSYATGSVSASISTNRNLSFVGGLVGENVTTGVRESFRDYSRSARDRHSFWR